MFVQSVCVIAVLFSLPHALLWIHHKGTCIVLLYNVAKIVNNKLNQHILASQTETNDKYSSAQEK